MITFTIPYPAGKAKAVFCRQLGLNAYYGGKHWAQRKKDADYLHILTHAALQTANIHSRMVTRPVEVRFYWDDGLDIDNHAVIGKAIVDALKGRLLPDDGPRWFRKVSHQFWNGGAIRVEIIPWEPNQ